MSELSTRVRNARNAAHLTQAQLAAKIGVKTAAVGLIETGSTKTLKAATAVKMSNALNVRPEWLVFGTGQMRQGGIMSTEARAVAEFFDKTDEKTKKEILGYISYVVARQSDSPPEISTLLKSLQT